MLNDVEVVAGYKTYIELIRPLIEDKEIISTGMTQEVKRVEAAVKSALAGKSCAIVSSGDPGIYAMAGLVFETCQSKDIPLVPPGCKNKNPLEPKALMLEIIPGIPALSAGASLLGAPLTHDFAAVSLSDLLTPWELIEKRLAAAAAADFVDDSERVVGVQSAADFVIVLYNPKSKKRSWQLERAQQIILNHRSPETPVGIVVGAMRPNQNIKIVPLSRLHEAEVDMQTTVFIGSSTSRQYLDFMYTPRGYLKKYRIGGEG